MTGEIVNLNRARKARARAEKRRQGDTNAALHGLTRAERTRQATEAERAAARIEAHRRVPGDPDGDGQQ